MPCRAKTCPSSYDSLSCPRESSLLQAKLPLAPSTKLRRTKTGGRQPPPYRRQALTKKDRIKREQILLLLKQKRAQNETIKYMGQQMQKHCKGEVAMAMKELTVNHILTTAWLMDLHPRRMVLLRHLMCIRHCTRHRPGLIRSLKQASLGAWSSLICFVTEQDSHYFTSLLNLQPKWQESNAARHRSGEPAPGVVRTLWTLSPAGSCISWTIRHTQGKANVRVSSLAA